MIELKRYAPAAITMLIASIVLKMLYPITYLTSIRAVIAIFLIAYLPGYIIVKLFFSKKYDWVENTALSFAFSIIFSTLSLIFSNTVLKIPFTSIMNFFVLISLSVIIAIAGIVYKKYRIKQKTPAKKQ